VVVKNIGGSCPDIELFADSQFHLTDNWVGPGSRRQDAFQLNWSYDRIGTFYANPPFSKLAPTIKQRRQDQAYGIWAIPNWDTKSWFQEAHNMAIKKFHIRQGESVFEDHRGPLPPPLWSVWALLMDGASEDQQSGKPSLSGDHQPRTKAKRRELRKRKKEHDKAREEQQQSQ
jgi:hypothetical protein